MSDNQLGVSSFSSFASVKKPVFRAVSLSPEPDQDLDGPSLLITPNPMTPLRAATLLAASKILVSSIFSFIQGAAKIRTSAQWSPGPGTEVHINSGERFCKELGTYSLRLPWKDLLWILNAFQFVLDKVPPPDPEEELPYYHVNCSPEFILYHPSGFRKDSTPVELCSIKMQKHKLEELKTVAWEYLERGVKIDSILPSKAPLPHPLFQSITGSDNEFFNLRKKKPSNPTPLSMSPSNKVNERRKFAEVDSTMSEKEDEETVVKRPRPKPKAASRNRVEATPTIRTSNRITDVVGKYTEPRIDDPKSKSRSSSRNSSRSRAPMGRLSHESEFPEGALVDVSDQKNDGNL